jgi:hypothetical protein
MTFFLKGNARELRFTGETRSLAHEGEPVATPDERPSGAALGKPRARRAAPPVRPPPPSMELGSDLRGDESLETALYHRPAGRAPRLTVPPATFVPMAPPIPHFRARGLDAAGRPRPRAEQWNVKTVLVPRARGPAANRGFLSGQAPRLPLVVWLAAALVAGALSFRFVPELVARGEAASITPPR